MKPVLSAEEMRAADEKTQETVGLEELIERAGHAVAHAALRLLGGAYGRRIVVIAGKGHNGDDGRVAARILVGRGARVEVLDPQTTSTLPPCELVIDAAFGTGFHGEYRAPTTPSDARVLAVDLPSGLDADTGVAGDGAVLAHATVTFGALKSGLLFGDGPHHAGEIAVADIGLAIAESSLNVVEDGDLAREILPRRRDGHKWDAGVYVLAGSPGMPGAATLTTMGAYRAGAGMVRLGSPGVAAGQAKVLEVVAQSLDPADFAAAVREELGRCKALVVGPGLGTDEGVMASVRDLLATAPVPTLIDADGLNALASLADWRALIAARPAPTVLTPHDGEFARLAGGPPGQDRVAAARRLAQESGAVVLLKGPATVVAAPDGFTLIANAGSARLSTAGTGDVLAGIIGAFLARGVAPVWAAGLGAHVHGRAAELGREGLVASDLPELVSEVLNGPKRHRHSRRRRRR